MNIFLYDHTFEGLLTSVFEAYSRRTFPDALLLEGEPLPLFYDGLFTVVTDEEKAGRVWRGLREEAVVYGTCLSGPVLAGRGAGNSHAPFPLYPQGNRCSSFH